MLKQLLKYEFKASSRWFGLCYIGILAAAVLVRIMMAFSLGNNTWLQQDAFVFMTDMLATTSVILYSVMIGAVFVLTFIAILQRFYKNLLGGEGYMMHTLPVPAWQHIVSKLIVSVVWVFLSGIVVALSIIILTITVNALPEAGRVLQDAGRLFAEEFGISGIIIVIELAVVSVLSVANAILHIYTAIMIGHQANKHRVLLAVVAYFGIDVVLNMIVSAVGTIVMLVEPHALFDAIDRLLMGNHYEVVLSIMLLIGIVWLAVLSGVFFAITERMMRKNLNLE